QSFTLLERRHLQERDHGLGAFIQGRRLEQRLLFPDVEGAEHGERAYQLGIRGAANGFPIALKPRSGEIVAQRLQQAASIPVGGGLLPLLFQIAAIGRPIRPDTAVAFKEWKLLDDLESQQPGQGDQVATILRLTKGGNSSSTAG